MNTITSKIEKLMARVSLEDSAYNCVQRFYPETASIEAEETDRRRANEMRLGPLDGCIFAVKDNLGVAGAPCTAGVAGRRAHIAQVDALVVRRLRAAGAILIGSLNMEEGALGTLGDNPVFGRCMNPLKRGYTPGGSSGGSAAAVAAGFVELALGTDTMGSIRLPAAYCGIIGLKPTFGLLGRSGLVPLATSLDTVGPLVRDAALLWQVLQCLAGHDAEDSDSRTAPTGWSHRPKATDLAGTTFGVPRQLSSVELEPEVAAAFETAQRVVTDLGGTIVDVDVAGWEPDRARRAGLLVIEAEAAVEFADLIDTEDAISPALHRLLVYGRDVTTERLLQAQQLLRATAAAVDNALCSVDALILPTAPQRAFPHGTGAPPNQADLMPLANFSGCPAVAMPVPCPGELLPASVQIVAPRWSEARLTCWTECLAPALSNA